MADELQAGWFTNAATTYDKFRLDILGLQGSWDRLG